MENQVRTEITTVLLVFLYVKDPKKPFEFLERGKLLIGKASMGSMKILPTPVMNHRRLIIACIVKRENKIVEAVITDFLSHFWISLLWDESRDDF